MSHGTAASEASPSDLAKLEADKRFSEFNHRLAGLFMLLVGFLALFEPHLTARFDFVRYLLMMVLGILLLVYTEWTCATRCALCHAGLWT